MSHTEWVIIAVGVGASFLVVFSVDEARRRIEGKLDKLIEEVRYPNLEAQKRELMGQAAYDEMNDML